MDFENNLAVLETWVTRIGATLDAPVFEEGTFIYPQVTAVHVAFLKAVRAVQSLHSLHILSSQGLLIDCGTILRCLFDCHNEIYFLLEAYPSVSKDVRRFVQHFASTSLVGGAIEMRSPASKKIQAARARLLEQHAEFSETFRGIRRGYEAFCTYVHSNYPAIMEIYGGKPGQRPDSRGKHPSWSAR